MTRSKLTSFLLCITVGIAFAKEPITENETDPVMLDIDPYMIEALYGTKKGGTKGRLGKNGKLSDLLAEPEFAALIEKHNLKLFNGPMLGNIQPNSVKFWLRTAGPAKVQIKVGDLVSKEVTTDAENDFAAVLKVEELEPFQDYTYSVLVDGEEIKRDAMMFRTAPEKGQKIKFDVAFGACSRYVPENESTWTSMAKTRPLAYLGLGDNVYIDVRTHQGAQRLFYYRRYLSPHYRDLVSSVGMYAVWDDHDFGHDDDAGGSLLDQPKWKMPNWQVFKNNWNNPAYGNPPEAPGTWFSFSLGDVDFFMTDGRFFRDKEAKTMLGAAQKKWLLNALANSKATFKVIGSGTMWSDGADKGGRDSWAGDWAREEREEIFSLINKNKINGVLLLAGDRHRTDIWKTDRPKGYPLYEFVSAKVTNLHTHKTFDNAVWSYNEGNFWGQLTFDLAAEDPVVTFRAYSKSGEVIKEFPLKLCELSH